MRLQHQGSLDHGADCCDLLFVLALDVKQPFQTPSERSTQENGLLTPTASCSGCYPSPPFHFVSYLQVVELRPEPQVTVLDTDMEIELDLPEKAREQLEEKGAQDRAKTLRAHMGGAATSAGSSPGQRLSPTPRGASAAGGGGDGRVLGGSGTAATTTSGVSPMDDSEDDDDSDLDSDDERSKSAKNAFDPIKHRLAKFEALPEEPPRDEEGVFTCQLRSPQGKFTRRFRFTDPLEVLLDFAESQGGVPGQYQLVVPFPRRVLLRDDASSRTTLLEAGLTSKQESVILERL